MRNEKLLLRFLRGMFLLVILYGGYYGCSGAPSKADEVRFEPLENGSQLIYKAGETPRSGGVFRSNDLATPIVQFDAEDDNILASKPFSAGQLLVLEVENNLWLVDGVQGIADVIDERTTSYALAEQEEIICVFQKTTIEKQSALNIVLYEIKPVRKVKEFHFSNFNIYSWFADRGPTSAYPEYQQDGNLFSFSMANENDHLETYEIRLDKLELVKTSESAERLYYY